MATHASILLLNNCFFNFYQTTKGFMLYVSAIYCTYQFYSALVMTFSYSYSYGSEFVLVIVSVLGNVS